MILTKLKIIKIIISLNTSVLEVIIAVLATISPITAVAEIVPAVSVYY